MVVLEVPTPMVPAVFPQVDHLLDEALSYGNGGLLMDDVKQMLTTGEMLLFIVLEGDSIVAAVAVELVIYPRKRSLRLVLLGGAGLGEWMLDLRDAMVSAAKRLGASFLELYGRPGWARALRAIPEVKQTATIVIMEVE